MAKERSRGGRPPRGLPSLWLIQELRRTQTIGEAATNLGVSAAYIYARLRMWGLTLREVQETLSLTDLLKRVPLSDAPARSVAGMDAEWGGKAP